MHKKLITACMALVALAAIALPAAAQAANNPLITHPTGSILATGTTIKATNIGETLLTNTKETEKIQVHCTTAVLTGVLTNNTTGNVQGEIQSASFTGTGSGGACTGTFANPTVDVVTLPWCLKSNTTMGEDTWAIFGGKCTEAAKKAEFKFTTSVGTCTYQSTTTTIASGFYTTHSTGDAQLTTNGEAHPANGYTKISDTTPFAICPSSGELSMTFTLETDTALAEPLYISS